MPCVNFLKIYFFSRSQTLSITMTSGTVIIQIHNCLTSNRRVLFLFPDFIISTSIIQCDGHLFLNAVNIDCIYSSLVIFILFLFKFKRPAIFVSYSYYRYKILMTRTFNYLSKLCIRFFKVFLLF